MLNKWFIIVVIGLSVLACTKQELKQYSPVFDMAYFPLDSGFWREFEVSSINIDAESEVFDTTVFFVKEIFTGWLLDAADDSAMRIERLYRYSKENPWQSFGVWQAAIKNHEAQQVEENIRYVKLMFPIQNQVKWDGNKYNRLDTLKQYQYRQEEIDSPYTIGEFTFDSTVTVIQKEKLSLIDKIDYREVFAYNLGLVYKQEVFIEQANTDNTSLPIEQRVLKGTFFYQRITSYGKF